ncbi:alpha/beta hydrolase [Rhodobacteraceae bacterium RKSG542]|uniref:alpha/beta fold hydrolase n=1 Tax=Pseudovibrio flavus TaxID=2529854 RepID=UPI0012BB5215|nr:alpha/beta hydrolase [Pseudovibrio flavus]MTI15753.1 alpha/beta hydrolase [Pseudovibrio flavus]
MPLTHPFPTASYIQLGDVTLEVFEAGRENLGNPIVLCHGWPQSAHCWSAQIPALAVAGYHVIAVNQRGYGHSSCPDEVEAYDIECLTGDLVGLLDFFGYESATFVGHDWGANVVWSMAVMHPQRISKIINLALPYQARTEVPWVEFLEAIFGAQHYMVHFNRMVGVADAVLDANAGQFLRNLFRKNVPATPPAAGNMMINLATAERALGDPIMSEEDLATLTAAFAHTGFTPSINWYRNLDRNWHILADYDPIIRHPSLMIYGEKDLIPPSEQLVDLVPNVEVVSLDCGHWIPQELPEETNRTLLHWLTRQNAPLEVC